MIKLDMNYTIISLIYLFLGLFELIFCFFKMEKLRKIFKAIPLFTLFISFCIISPNSYLLYIPLLFYCIGDIFLLSLNKKMFVSGCNSFFVGHIIYTVYIFYSTYNTNEFNNGLLIFSIIYIVSAIIIYIILNKKIGFYVYPGLLYFSLQLALVSYTLYFFISTNEVNYLLFSLGFLIYFLSDLIVLYKRFFKRFNKDDFYIMLTYYIAVFLVFSGCYFSIF